MSSRAAGGRKRQLRPLQPQGPSAPPPLPPNPGQEFLPQTAPAQIYFISPLQPNTAAFAQESAYPYQGAILHARNPTEPGFLSKSFIQQLPPTARPQNTAAVHHSQYQHPETLTISPNGTYFEAPYQSPPPIGKLHSESPRLLVSPAPSEPSHRSEPPSLSEVFPTSPPISARRRPSPLYILSGDNLANTGHHPTDPSHGYVLLQPTPHFHPTPEFSGNRTSPRLQALPPHSRTQFATDAQNYLSPFSPPGGHRQFHYGSNERSAVYPSPPVSSPSLALSPLSWSSSSSGPDDSASSHTYPSSLQSSRPSSSLAHLPTPPSSDGSHRPQRGNLVNSMNSTSVEPSQHSSYSNTAPSSFVFPGSRSTARPKVSAKMGTSQLMRGKSGATDHADERNHSYPSPSILSAESYPDAYLPASPPHSTGHVESRSPSVPPMTIYPKKVSPGSSNASTDSSNASSQAFFFPPGRSRAHPRKAPGLSALAKRNSTKKPRGAGGKKFMGISLGKKKANSLYETDSGSSLYGAETLSVAGMSISGSSDDNERDGRERNEKLEPDSLLSPSFARENTKGTGVAENENLNKKKGKHGVCLLNPYDSVLLDNDRHTGALLHRLNPTNTPSFHDYGNSPPATVLDLGCGQGLWAFDAAIAWKEYGTKITAFDMVDIIKPFWPWATSQGIAANIKFVRGNFVKRRLPFADDSFDLVRMSCLALCIATDSWEPVLREVSRVLTPGGRLELIDDQIFFPYGKAPPVNSSSIPTLPFPRLDIAPSAKDRFSVFATSSIGAGTINPGLGMALAEEESGMNLYNLYGVAEDTEAEDKAQRRDDEADIVTLSSREQGTTGQATRLPELNVQYSLTASEWNQQQDVSKDLEELFEDMLTRKYGVHINPSAFLLGLLKTVFGHAREMETLHLTLAPPLTDQGNNHHLSASHMNNSRHGVFSESPGLFLWPSTLIPMPRIELEIHASRNLRILLSCKNALVEHALRVAREDDIDEDSVLEAIWEYENFLRQRFQPPPGDDADTQTLLDSDLSYHAPPPSRYQDFPSASRTSVYSVATEYQDAMWEYQQDFRRHFAWPSKGSGTDITRSDTPGPSGLMANSSEHFGSKESNPRDTLVPTPTAVPSYSRADLTHVRTFRVYEAVKMDKMAFGSAI